MTATVPGRSRGGPRHVPAQRIPVLEVRHGLEISDPYQWLEDSADPATRRWVAAQQAMTDVLVCQRSTRRALSDRVAAFTGTGMVAPPIWRGDRQFVLRRHPGQELAALYLVEPDGAERALLDPLALDSTGLTTLDHWRVSWDGRLVAYQVSRRGTEQSLLYVCEVDSGTLIDGPINRLRRAPVVWAPTSDGFWYVRRLAGSYGQTTVAPRRLFWHPVGAEPAHDELVFGAGTPVTIGLWPELSHGRWLTIRTTLGTSAHNGLWVADLRQGSPAAPGFHPVIADFRAAVTPAVGITGQLYLCASLDAPRGRLCSVSLDDLDRLAPAHWNTLIAEGPDSVLRSVVPLAGGRWGAERLLVLRTRHSAVAATIHDPQTGRQLDEVPLPGAGNVSGVTLPPGGGRAAWFRYADHATPATVMRFDLDRRQVLVHARPAGTVPELPAARSQVAYRSADGTRVRMFVIAPAECAGGPDRPRPTLLTGYGGFGVSMVPEYRGDAMPWVEAGGVIAVACVRGGGDEGHQWHQDATGTGRQRGIDDFLAAAEWLVARGWTSTSQLAAAGGSNGGLLVTAAMVQRPELFAAVAAHAPLTDMLRYERFGLGPLWRSEYGTVEDPDQFAALLKYSPYHQVRAETAYPAVLLTAADGDTRVPPLHSRKLCAALQHATSANRPILFRCLPDAGHGVRAQSAAVSVTAETLAFLAEQTGLLG